LGKSEFVEFVYRIADHIYDKETYAENSESAAAGTAAQIPDEVPSHVTAMLDEPMYVKFKHVLQ